MAKFILLSLIAVCVFTPGLCEGELPDDETVDARTRSITYFMTSSGNLYPGMYNLTEKSATWCINVKPIIFPRNKREICLVAVVDFKHLQFEFNVTANGRTMIRFHVDKLPEDCIEIPLPWSGPKLCLNIYEFELSENRFHMCADFHLHLALDLVQIYLPCIDYPSKLLEIIEKLQIDGNSQ